MATGPPPGPRPLDPAELPARLAAEVAAALRLLPARDAAAMPLAPVLFRFTLAGGPVQGGAGPAPREVRVALAPDRLDIVETAPREARHGG